jgi:Sulfotransferase domain
LLRIIGAGLPRTATLTQKIALETLGLGPCYHMVTVLSDLDRVESWKQALQGESRWPDIFSGFSASVDWPGAFFYRELIDVYPQAKVLLSVRDAHQWAESMRATVLRANRGDNVMRHLSLARADVDASWRAYNEMTSAMLFGPAGLLPTGDDDETTLVRASKRYVDEVRATVPASRLLVWEAADGWAPLCDFFDAPVPEQPLPRVNDAAMFEDRVVEGALGALNRWWAERPPAGHRAVAAGMRAAGS